jgi:hypothetical protein
VTDLKCAMHIAAVSGCQRKGSRGPKRGSVWARFSHPIIGPPRYRQLSRDAREPQPEPASSIIGIYSGQPTAN